MGYRTRRIINDLRTLNARVNHLKYTIDEPTTIPCHQYQVAHVLLQNQESDELIVAGLTHDIGHYVNPKTMMFVMPIAPSLQKNDFHEIKGAQFLQNLGLPKTVYEPIRLHVFAKRFLVTQAYKLNQNYPLSHGSRLSLALQGGLMSEEEQEKFLKEVFASDAIKLRKADESGKHDKQLCFEQFVPFLEKVLSK